MELSPLKLDGVFLQLGLETLDGVVHPVHFHLPQDLKDPPVVSYTKGSVELRMTQRSFLEEVRTNRPGRSRKMV